MGVRGPLITSQREGLQRISRRQRQLLRRISDIEPFVHVAQQRMRGHDGLGLGLAVSRDPARVMHGHLTAASEPGGGSIFTLRLPRCEP